MTEYPKGKGQRVTRNISLQRDHELAIQFLAQEAGHGVPSQAMQELLEREMFARFGRDWRHHLRVRARPVPTVDPSLELVPA